MKPPSWWLEPRPEPEPRKNVIMGTVLPAVLITLGIVFIYGLYGPLGPVLLLIWLVIARFCYYMGWFKQ